MSRFRALNSSDIFQTLKVCIYVEYCQFIQLHYGFILNATVERLRCTPVGLRPEHKIEVSNCWT